MQTLEGVDGNCYQNQGTYGLFSGLCESKVDIDLLFLTL